MPREYIKLADAIALLKAGAEMHATFSGESYAHIWIKKDGKSHAIRLSVYHAIVSRHPRIVRFARRENFVTVYVYNNPSDATAAAAPGNSTAATGE